MKSIDCFTHAERQKDVPAEARLVQRSPLNITYRYRNAQTKTQAQAQAQAQAQT